MEIATQHNNSITICKAIGIVLVVLGHTIGYLPTEPYIFTHKVIYAFHMPLFFIMSGFCFKEKYLYNPKDFFLRKIKGIYLPYVTFSIAFLLLHNTFCLLHIIDSSDTYSYYDILHSLFSITTRMCGEDTLFLQTFWFLRDLFWGNLIFFISLKICRLKKWLLWLCLLTITEFLSFSHLYVPYWGITNKTLYATLFICTGYIIRKQSIQIDRLWKILVCLSVFCIQIWLGNNPGMKIQSSTSIILYWFAATAATLLTLKLSLFLDSFVKTKLISFIGRHTFSIMALHFIAFKLVSLIIIYTYSLPIESLVEFPIIRTYATLGWWIPYTIIGIIIPLLLVQIWNKVLLIARAIMSPIKKKLRQNICSKKNE